MVPPQAIKSNTSLSKNPKILNLTIPITAKKNYDE